MKKRRKLLWLLLLFLLPPLIYYAIPPSVLGYVKNERSMEPDSGKLHYFGSCAFLISDTGDLYGWGSTRFKGIENRLDSLYANKRLLTDVKSMEFSGLACLALRENGELWGWGASGSVIPQSIHSDEFQTKLLDDVVDFDISLDVCLAVQSNGDLWIWGTTNNWNGPSFQAVKEYEPQVILHDIADVYVNGSSMFVIDNQGDAYLLGRYGVGPVFDSKQVCDQFYVASDVAAIDFLCDDETSSWYQVLLNNGEILKFHAQPQWNDDGTPYLEPAVPTGQKAFALRSGGFLMEDGTLWRWNADSKTFEPELLAEHVLDASSGTYPAMIFYEDGTIALHRSDGTVDRTYTMEIFAKNRWYINRLWIPMWFFST